jgi:hypothetical protein
MRPRIEYTGRGKKYWTFNRAVGRLPFSDDTDFMYLKLASWEKPHADGACKIYIYYNALLCITEYYEFIIS